jgi:ABC-type spermidine/putrescine transport system permease subunit I
MYGNQIVDLFYNGFPDWETGATLALFLIAVISVLVFVFIRFLRLGEPAAA